jgi:hypothetical protein
MQAKEKIKISLEDIVPEDREKMSCMKCLVCNNILETAFTDTCGHIYCRDCVMPTYSVDKKCPVSGLELLTDPTPVHYLDSVINRAKMYCPNKAKVCTWEGIKSSVEDHILTECPKEMILCPYDRCGVQVLREVISFHNENCAYRRLCCEYCKESVAYLDLDKHFEICEYLPTTCTNNCGQMVPKKEVVKHVEAECPKTIIACPFAYRGCTYKIERSMLDNHLNSSLGKHILFLSDKKTPTTSPTLMNLLNELNDKVSKTDTKLSQLKEDFKEDIYKVNSHLEKMTGVKRPREETEDEELSDLEARSLGKNIHFYASAKDEQNFTVNGKVIKHTADRFHTVVFHKYKKTPRFNDWRITINSESESLAFGLCDKAKLFNAKERHSENVKQGYFLNNSGEVYNCTNPEEHEVKNDNFILKKDDSVQFRYRKDEGTLSFKTSTGHQGKLTKVSNISSLTPCIVFLYKNDEVTLDY